MKKEDSLKKKKIFLNKSKKKGIKSENQQMKISRRTIRKDEEEIEEEVSQK